MQRLAGGVGRSGVRAHHVLAEELALVHGQFALGHVGLLGGAPRTLRRVHTVTAVEHPGGQRRVGDGLAGINVGLDPLGHLLPAGFLPDLEGALLHAEAPAHGEVHFAGRFSDRFQRDGGVVEGVAQQGPDELGLRVSGLTQGLQALGGGLAQDVGDFLVGLVASGHVLAGLHVELRDDLAVLLEEAGLGLLTKVALVQQRLHIGRHGERGSERIGGAAVLQRLDHVGHRVDADHVAGAVGARGGTAHALAGQVVDHVVAQAEVLHFDHGEQQTGHAHAVGDEVGAVFAAHHALADSRGHEGLELVDHHGIGVLGRDQLDQVHVARGVEEVDAQEARAQLLGQHVGHGRDGQARRVGGQDGLVIHEGRDLLVQIFLPVQTLGDGFDDQVAATQLFQVLFVVGLLDQHGVVGHAQRRGLELLEVLDGLGDDPVLGTFLGGQVEQHDRHLAVDQMGGDLRAHHAGAEHGDLADIESTHVLS